MYAVNMAKGLSFADSYGVATTYRGPGYPLFMSIFYFLYGASYNVTRIALAFLSSGTCILIYFLAKKIFSKLTGYIAAFMNALFSLSIFYCGFLYSETLYIFLTAALALLLYNTLEKPTRKNLVLSGLLLGPYM